MKARALALAPLLMAVPGGADSGVIGQLRFHHLHVRTEDPAAAMNDVARRTGGTRVILQGLGVGVRIVDQYVLFERIAEGVSASSDPGATAPRYASAVRWLRARSFDVVPTEFSGTRVAAALPDTSVDHLAFATEDLIQTVTALQRAGVEPVRRTAESAWFATGDGTVLEITRDSDRPDAFWCPMHPEVRSSAPERCPICSMTLVPLPPPTLGQYDLSATQVPRAGGSGTAALRFEIRHPQTSARVAAFSEIHERLLHLFIVGRDLAYFAHVHPEPSGAGFEVPVDLDPGAYVLIADFVPAGGTPQLVQHAIVTPGYSASPFVSATLTSDLADKIVDGVRISLRADVKAQNESVLRFTLRDAATGAPITDLEPYLGASGHLLVVNPEVTVAIHAHPETVATRGPDVVFGPVLPAAGVYKLWAQFQRGGKVLTVPFAISGR